MRKSSHLSCCKSLYISTELNRPKESFNCKTIIFKIVQKKKFLCSCGNLKAAVDFRSRLFKRFTKFCHHFRLRLISRNRERKGSLSCKHNLWISTEDCSKETAIEKTDLQKFSALSQPSFISCFLFLENQGNIFPFYLNASISNAQYIGSIFKFPGSNVLDG